MRQGAWFVFDAGSHRIHAWFSTRSGRSRIFVDGRCVHEARDFRRRGRLDFRVGHAAAQLSLENASSRRLQVALHMAGAPAQRQAFAFSLPLGIRISVLAVDLVCVFGLWSAVMHGALGVGLGVLVIAVLVLGLATVERLLFGRLHPVVVAPDA